MSHRIVVDTNVLISATFWGGQPRRIVDLIKASKATLLTTPELTDELRTVLSYAKFERFFKVTGRTVEGVMAEYQDIAEIVAPSEIPHGVIRDEKDRIVLAAAICDWWHSVLRRQRG